jgi:hypothetical protein
MFFLSTWFADKQMESIPELADLPSQKRHQIADECACRTAISGVGLGLTAVYVFLFAYADDVVDSILPGAPWWVTPLVYGAIVLVSVPLAMRARKAYDRRFREEVREYLRKYGHHSRDAPSAPQ